MLTYFRLHAPFSPSLINLMVSVDVKHHVYLLTNLALRSPQPPSTATETWPSLCCDHSSVERLHATACPLGNRSEKRGTTCNLLSVRVPTAAVHHAVQINCVRNVAHARRQRPHSEHRFPVTSSKSWRKDVVNQSLEAGQRREAAEDSATLPNDRNRL